MKERNTRVSFAHSKHATMVVFLSDFVISWRRQRVVPQVCFSYKLLTYFDHESMQRVLSELFVFLHPRAMVIKLPISAPSLVERFLCFCIVSVRSPLDQSPYDLSTISLPTPLGPDSQLLGTRTIKFDRGTPCLIDFQVILNLPRGLRRIETKPIRCRQYY